MPSPIAHAAAGYAVYVLLRNSKETESRLLGTTILFSLLPDADSFLGLATRNFALFHNNISHSIGFALGVGTLYGAIYGWGKGLFWRWFSASFLAYSLHLALDYWSTRRGILLLWPFSKRRFVSPTKLFYGFQWGRGIWSVTHLWTALSELFFGLSLIISMRWLIRRLKT